LCQGALHLSLQRHRQQAIATFVRKSRAVIVAPQAESDLDEIWYFLATQSSSIDVADRVIDSITAAAIRFRGRERG